VKSVNYNNCESLSEFSEMTLQGLTNLYSSDFVENLKALPYYLKSCKSYRELGTNQGGSASIALLQNLTYIELIDKSFSKFNIKKYLFDDYANDKNIKLIYHEMSSLDVQTNKKTDFLLVDSVHKYKHVTAELNLYAPLTRKFIMFHDTNMLPVYQAVKDFLNQTKEWKLAFYSDSAGYTVLERI